MSSAFPDAATLGEPAAILEHLRPPVDETGERTIDEVDEADVVRAGELGVGEDVAMDDLAGGEERTTGDRPGITSIELSSSLVAQVPAHAPTTQLAPSLAHGDPSDPEDHSMADAVYPQSQSHTSEPPTIDQVVLQARPSTSSSPPPPGPREWSPTPPQKSPQHDSQSGPLETASCTIPPTPAIPTGTANDVPSPLDLPPSSFDSTAPPPFDSHIPESPIVQPQPFVTFAAPYLPPHRPAEVTRRPAPPSRLPPPKSRLSRLQNPNSSSTPLQPPEPDPPSAPIQSDPGPGRSTIATPRDRSATPPLLSLVFIDNLGFAANRKNVESALAVFGPLKKVDVQLGLWSSYAHVEFELPVDARRAVRKLQGTTLTGRPVQLRLVESPVVGGRNKFDKPTTPAKDVPPPSLEASTSSQKRSPPLRTLDQRVSPPPLLPLPANPSHSNTTATPGPSASPLSTSKRRPRSPSPDHSTSRKDPRSNSDVHARRRDSRSPPPPHWRNSEADPYEQRAGRRDDAASSSFHRRRSLSPRRYPPTFSNIYKRDQFEYRRDQFDYGRQLRGRGRSPQRHDHSFPPSASDSKQREWDPSFVRRQMSPPPNASQRYLDDWAEEAWVGRSPPGAMPRRGDASWRTQLCYFFPPVAGRRPCFGRTCDFAHDFSELRGFDGELSSHVPPGLGKYAQDRWAARKPFNRAALDALRLAEERTSSHKPDDAPPPNDLSQPPPPPVLRTQTELDLMRLKSLNLSLEDIAAIQRIWTPQNSTSKILDRTVHFQASFGSLPRDVATRALNLAPAFSDPVLQERYEIFLESQTGENMSHYLDFLDSLVAFNENNKEFESIARKRVECAGRDEVALEVPYDPDVVAPPRIRQTRWGPLVEPPTQRLTRMHFSPRVLDAFNLRPSEAQG